MCVFFHKSPLLLKFKTKDLQIEKFISIDWDNYQNVIYKVKFCIQPWLTGCILAREIKESKNTFLVNHSVGVLSGITIPYWVSNKAQCLSNSSLHVILYPSQEDMGGQISLYALTLTLLFWHLRNSSMQFSTLTIKTFYKQTLVKNILVEGWILDFGFL